MPGIKEFRKKKEELNQLLALKAQQEKKAREEEEFRKRTKELNRLIALQAQQLGQGQERGGHTHSVSNLETQIAQARHNHHLLGAANLQELGLRGVFVRYHGQQH